MKTITVKKDVLLEILKNNRTKHRAIFEEALEGYRKKCIELLERHLQDIKTNKKYRLYITMMEPVDQTKEYDLAIGMLEMDINDEVELTSQEYSNYVKDNWAWTGNFLASNSAYSVTAATLSGEVNED